MVSLSQNHDMDTGNLINIAYIIWNLINIVYIIRNSLYPLNTLELATINELIVFVISNRTQKQGMPIPVNIVTKAKVKTEFLYIYKFNVVFFRLFKSSSK